MINRSCQHTSKGIERDILTALLEYFDIYNQNIARRAPPPPGCYTYAPCDHHVVSFKSRAFNELKTISSDHEINSVIVKYYLRPLGVGIITELEYRDFKFDLSQKVVNKKTPEDPLVYHQVTFFLSVL